MKKIRKYILPSSVSLFALLASAFNRQVSNIDPVKRLLTRLTISGIYVLCFYCVASSHADALPLSRRLVQTEDFQMLYEVAENAKSTNELVKNLAEAFPDVHYVVKSPFKPVSGDVKSYSWLSDEIITFNDDRIPEKFLKHYMNYGIGTGTYFPPQYMYGKLKFGRPVIGLFANSPRSTIIHETLHYLIDRASESKVPTYEGRALDEFYKRNQLRREPLSALAEESLNRFVEQLRGNEAEHVDIAVLLLRSREAWQLSPEEIKVTHERLAHYMSEAMLVLPDLISMYSSKMKQTHLPKGLQKAAASALITLINENRPVFEGLQKEFGVKRSRRE